MVFLNRGDFLPARLRTLAAKIATIIKSFSMISILTLLFRILFTKKNFFLADQKTIKRK
jgi:hypothetical protein